MSPVLQLRFQARHMRTAEGEGIQDEYLISCVSTVGFDRAQA